MATKLELIQAMYDRVCDEVVRSPEHWAAFLQSACRNYNCSFMDQMMIFAQRPDATAVLEIQDWNRIFKRRVQRGAHGIAVFDVGEKQRLKYYFDVSDTYPTAEARPVPIWRHQPDRNEALLRALVRAYQTPRNMQGSLSATILSAVHTATVDQLSGHQSDLQRIGLSADNRELISLISMSVTYMVMSRLQMAEIKTIPLVDIVLLRGKGRTAMQTVAEAVNQIGRSVLKTIAREIQTINRNIERGTKDHDRDYLQQAGGLLPSESDHPGQSAGNSDVALRAATQTLSAGAPAGILHGIGDTLAAGAASDRNSGTGEQSVRSSGGADDSIGGVDGSTQSAGHDGVGWTDKQHPDARGQVGIGGDHLRLIWHREEEDRSIPFLHEDNIIKKILQTAPHWKQSRNEIQHFFSSHPEHDEQTEYIAHVFNDGQTQFTLEDGRRFASEAYENGLRLWEGESDLPQQQGFYQWGVIANYVSGMILTQEWQDKSQPLPDSEAQLLLIAEAAPVQFSFSQELIDAVLARGSGISEGKMRIFEIYQQQLTPSERVSCLRSEYGIGGSSLVIAGTGISEMHDSKGIALTRGNLTHPEATISLSWTKVEARIGELIRAGRYLNRAESERYPLWRTQQEEICFVQTRRNTQTDSPEKNQITPQKSSTDLKELRYALDDTVFLGASEYVIAELDSTSVVLSDAEFPLFTQEMSRAELEQRITETPGNEALWHESDAAESKPEIPTEADADAGTQNTVVAVQRGVNYRITGTAENLPGGAKAKYRANLDAIHLLKQLESEGRSAEPQEQAVLAKYVGWGGLPEAFDEKRSDWTAEYQELCTALTQKEYEAARESTLTSFYTPQPVITVIYDALEKMGFHQGNILEPSCGIGNFLGLLPDSMKNSKLYGVELDSISGRIARQLYPESKIAVQGYEDAQLPDSFFDAAVGNVPFGQFKLRDQRYDKYNFLIHDYFFAKTLDKVRPGGIVALITSKGTMDKANSSVRKYIAQRAELIGAIRLPDNTFTKNAGTEVTSDILFLQKRDRPIVVEPDWVSLDQDKNGIPMNRYFVAHPEMILGTMETEIGRFGTEYRCKAKPDADLTDLLRKAAQKIGGAAAYSQPEMPDADSPETHSSAALPADAEGRNFSYTLHDGLLYYRRDSVMQPVHVPAATGQRIRGMISIRDTVRRMLDLQMNHCTDEMLQSAQGELTKQYQAFTKQYGLLSSRANRSAFREDSSFALLSGLEVVNEDGTLRQLADMFTKRTIQPHIPVTHVDTASEALSVSMAEKARVDLDYMSELSGKSQDQLIAELQGVIFRDTSRMTSGQISTAVFDPSTLPLVTADEYLSGNVREKLRGAKAAAAAMQHQARQTELFRAAKEGDDAQPVQDHTFDEAIRALEAVQPQDLEAGEISVRLGATWLPPEVIQNFIFETLHTPPTVRRYISVLYAQASSDWNITGKSYDQASIRATKTYGTARINAYKIIEDTLNQRDVRIYDYIQQPDGSQKPVLNGKETELAQGKQRQLAEAFQNWIWQDADRRRQLVSLYNEKFNSTRPREYNGSHLVFDGINPEIRLELHQKNAIAHSIYGGNTLLAHAVGAGKSFEMIAIAQESKRLGLCSKSMLVVPNHLTEQMAEDYLKLYPAANILVATKRDFEKENRRRFCARIATGDYDAVIVGHSQLEKIPISQERQEQQLRDQIDEITQGVVELKASKAENFTIKQMEGMRKRLQSKLKTLSDQPRDDVVTFEELGVDRLFVDEAHYFKNLFLYTKMRNVAGISQTEAKKSSDLFAKCRYLDEKTGNRGIVFATGTPISNSMTEMYTMQRYLQYNTLERLGLQQFDSWASTFGETVTAMELAPEGTGYRMKTRFARFYNLPELMSIFRENADIKTADQLALPVPDAKFHTEVCHPSPDQKELVQALGERAEEVRKHHVDPSADNMLNITNDGRKLALDQRLADPLLPDYPDSKVNRCCENVFRIWSENMDTRAAQLVFCDLSTPKKGDSFNVYDSLKQKLLEKGVPESEIAFIHNANTEEQKAALFAKVRAGEVRVLLGSTQKMGAGTNCQDRLLALHDLDAPWRPSDLEQRAGRIIRRGNTFSKVDIYRYVTEDTFDAYLWQTIENKQKFISQIMTSKSPVRVADDIDEAALSYAEIKMLATGNPYVKEKMDLDAQVSKLKLLKADYLSTRYRLEDMIAKDLPNEIVFQKERIAGLSSDAQQVESYFSSHPDFVIELDGHTYTDRGKAGSALLECIHNLSADKPGFIGSYAGFALFLVKEYGIYNLKAAGKKTYTVELGVDVHGNLQRLDNALKGISERLEACRSELSDTEGRLEDAKKDVLLPFAHEEELAQKSARLEELNTLLNIEDQTTPEPEPAKRKTRAPEI